MSIKASRSLGFGLAIVAVSAFAACSSEDTSNPNNGNNNTGGSSAGSGTAGTAPKAGTTSTTGGSGTAGSGTAGSGTSGSGTAGSGGAANNFPCAGTKPAAPLITEFADLTPNATSAGQFNFTAGVPGGTFAYQPAALTVTNPTGTLNVKGNIAAYDGFGVYFTSCTDASAYTGVSFNIKGNAGPTGKLSFRFQTNANTAVDQVNKKGACVVPAGTADPYPLCHAAMFDITVTPGGSVVEVKFSDAAGGAPVATVDGKDIIGLEWAFPWMGAADTAYDADVTVDDIKFIGGGNTGGTGGGGGGGAGGGGGSGGGAGGGGGSGGTQ
jgi:hypothetical protein